MFDKKINIEFISKNKDMLDILPKPCPASNNLPEWYKSMPLYTKDKKHVYDNGDPNSTIKNCMPFFDGMTAGYHIPLPSDVWIDNEDGDLKFKWAIDDMDVIQTHLAEQHNLYPTPEGYMIHLFKWINPWIIKTPKGYSCLFTHPLHYDDLPFKCLSAVVDTDKHPTNINFAFFLKKNFHGFIPQGTPIIQVIPFKREKYNSIYHSNHEKLDIMWKKAKTHFFNRYKRFFRSTKVYTSIPEKETKCPFSRFLK
jgi:hypothetical protein